MRALRRVALGWLIWRVLGPEPKPRFRAPQEHPLRVPGRSLFVGDREFFVREAGDTAAPPIVLVHGWGDHSAVVWHRLIPLLAERRRVVAVDLRSHGRSAPERGTVDVVDLADDVAAVITGLGLASVPVVGYSLGGLISQVLAHRHSGLVSHLVLGGTLAGGHSTLRRLGLSTLWTLGRAADRISRVEGTAIKYAYLRSVRAIERRHGRWLWTELLSRDPELYWQTGFAALRYDGREIVARLSVPVLQFITTDDQIVPVAAQYDLAGRLPDPELLELFGARHEAPITHADRIAEAILQFVEKEATR